MAQSFPLALATLADKIRWREVSFQLDDNAIFTGLASGDVISHQMAPRKWRAVAKSGKYSLNEGRQIQAAVEFLDGSVERFQLFNPLAKYPQSDPTGSILGGSSVVIASLNVNNKELTLSGLPAGYVLTMGDMLSFGYGSSPTRRALHRIMNTVTANGSGVTPSIEVRPHIRTGAATSAAVQIAKPYGLFVMEPESFKMSLDQDLRSCSFSMEAVQVFK